MADLDTLLDDLAIDAWRDETLLAVAVALNALVPRLAMLLDMAERRLHRITGGPVTLDRSPDLTPERALLTPEAVPPEPLPASSRLAAVAATLGAGAGVVRGFAGALERRKQSRAGLEAALRERAQAEVVARLLAGTPAAPALLPLISQRLTATAAHARENRS